MPEIVTGVNVGKKLVTDLVTGNSGTDDEPSVPDKATYGKIAGHVREWLALHRDEKFDLDKICRQLSIQERDNRKYVAIELSKQVRAGKLEKNESYYRYIDNTLITIDWVHNNEETGLSALQWPCGQDNTQFGFDGRVEIPEKGLIVIAGVSNTGKSVFCRNFLWANMDIFNCRYFSSETSGPDFREYAQRMSWRNPIDADTGKPKFALVERYENFHDVIDPDGVNIIDWLNPGTDFYIVGSLLQKIKEKLRCGIALVALQKDVRKELGVGGQFSEHLASLYITLDYNRLTVVKAKKYHDWNPNGRIFGFDIIDRGTHFTRIRLLKRCGYCKGGVTNRGKCDLCDGTGYVDDELHP